MIPTEERRVMKRQSTIKTAATKSSAKKSAKPQSPPRQTVSRSKRESANPVFARGLDVRRAMWGHEGAEGQIDSASDFIWPMQDYVTRWCFGETWTRTKLPRKTRSMITLGILVAQGRPHELKVHVRGAIANGVSKEEIQEVLLHAMIYSGIPRGVEGFRSAAEVLREMGLE
jgi:4-carboxymuconolactone decarboxylase